MDSFSDRQNNTLGIGLGAAAPKPPQGPEGTRDPILSRSAPHLVDMDMPYDRAIWQSHMAEPYGSAIWQSHMAAAAAAAAAAATIFCA